jgi:hypothetical protein
MAYYDFMPGRWNTLADAMRNQQATVVFKNKTKLNPP